MVIIVEGKDDRNFIRTVLNDLKKKQEISVEDTINFDDAIEIMGGKRKLLDSSNAKYQKLKMKIENNDIEKALFIFDCDFERDDKECNGIDNSKKCFEKLKNDLQWEIPIEVHIFNRNLDYFLVETIKTKECYEYFDQLVECLEIEKVKPNKKPIANLYRDLYPAPHFAFEDDKFNDLKQKLKNLFEGTQ